MLTSVGKNRAWYGRPILILSLGFVVIATLFLSMASLANKSSPLTIDFPVLYQSALTMTGASQAPVIREWERLLSHTQDMTVAQQLKAVNDFFHRHVTYTEDQDNWGKSDYWATPLETLTRGAGDCEDYSIGKYVSLLQAGIPNEQLRLIYVRARIGGTTSPISRPHMVLAYYETPQSEPLILDSLTRDILPAKERTDLLPVFSFNSEGLWVGGGSTSAASPTQRLSRWRNVIERMNKEGIQWQDH